MRKEIIKAKNNQTLDLKILESKGIDILHSKIYFLGIELTGGNESKSLGCECFFGALDSKDSHIGLDTLKPIYHLISETDYDTKDSKESFTQTLQIFLNNSTLAILNYSLLDSSLNIKLECNSKESKEILEKEQTQREQQKQDSKMSDSLLIAYNNTESKKVV